MAELFEQVLGLCREAGLVSVGVITVDGTKVHGERVDGISNLDYGQLLGRSSRRRSGSTAGGRAVRGCAWR